MSSAYNDDSMLCDLARQLPPGSVSVAHADRLAGSVDLWPRHVIRMAHGTAQMLPRAVVWPTCVEHVQTIVLHARDHGISVVPYSAGSSVVGGATPSAQQIVIDMKRLNRVHTIDRAQRMATAQVGVMGETWERTLQRDGLTQGHFPSSIYCSSLGGWIGARSAGQMSSRYGKIEDQILGGVAVLGDGRRVEHDPSPVRGPLLDSLIGAEGQGGIWVEATVRVHALPHAQRFCAFDFPDLPSALHAAERWLHVGIVPSVVRIYDPLDSYLHRGTHAEQAPHDRGPNWLAFFGANFPKWVNRISRVVAGACRCIVMLEGTVARDASPNELAHASALLAWEYAQVQAIAAAYHAIDLGPGPAEHWYARRHAVSYRQSNAFRAGVAVDTMEVACQWNKVLPVYEAVQRAGLALGVQVLAHFSHMYRDGASIYFTYAMPLRRGERGYTQLWQQCLAAAIGAGANVSHHHGVGRLKAGHLATMLGAGAARVREQWQQQVDPNRVCNPEVLQAPVQSVAIAPTLAITSHDDADAIHIDGEWVGAAPHHTVGSVEAALQRAGLTLGWIGACLQDWTLLSACRMGWLYRSNCQLRVIEPVLAGVAGDMDGAPYGYVPAPRAAQGPELVQHALAYAPRRMWLRAQPLRFMLATITLRDGATGLRVLQSLSQHPSTSGLPMAAHGHTNGACVLQIGLSQHGRHDGEACAVRDVVHGICPEADQECVHIGAWVPPLGSDIANAHLPRVPPQAAAAWFGIAGTWTRIAQWIQSMPQHSTWMCLCTDPVGAMGLVHASLHMPETSVAAMRATAQLAGVLLGDERVSMPRANARHDHTRLHENDDPLRRGLSWNGLQSQHRSMPMAMTSHRAALDNCTYCPKLCRFSCPTADAAGEEAITPRQLMHTVNMHARQQTPLSHDTAARLYSCVDCRGCRSFCDHDNDVANVLQHARAELFTHGHTPDAVRAVVTSLINTGRMPDRPDADHPRHWRQSPAFPSPAMASTRLFFGCQGSVSDPTPIANAWHVVQQASAPEMISVMPHSMCCGHPLWRWGARDAFQAHAQKIAASMHDVQQIIVDDPGCAYTFKELYARVGIQMPIVRTLQSCASTLCMPASPLAPAHHPQHAPHDACFATRWLGEPTLRAQAAAMDVTFAPGSVVESQSGCCGGMLLPFYDAALAQRTAEMRVRDLLGGGAERIMTASPTCRRRLRSITDRVDDWTSVLTRSCE